MSKNLEDLIYEETKRKLDIMESKEYEFPKRITKVDIYIIISIRSLKTQCVYRAICSRNLRSYNPCFP